MRFAEISKKRRKEMRIVIIFLVMVFVGAVVPKYLDALTLPVATGGNYSVVADVIDNGGGANNITAGKYTLK